MDQLSKYQAAASTLTHLKDKWEEDLIGIEYLFTLGSHFYRKFFQMRRQAKLNYKILPS